MDMAAILVTDFHFHVPKRLHIKFGNKRPGVVLEKYVLIFIHKWPSAKVKK